MTDTAETAESVVGSMADLTLQASAVPSFLEETIANIVAFLPRLLGAVVILLIGWVVGRILAGVVRELVARTGLDGHLVGTPIGRFMGGKRDAVSNVLGKVTAYYVYLLALVAAANVLAVSVLSEWVTRAVSYVPSLIAGLLIILVGFVVADFVGDAIARSESVTNDHYTSVFADGVRFFLYFVVVTIGLDTIGVETTLLYILARATAYGLGAALAIGLGVAIGLGGKDYVAEHIDGWLGDAKERANRGAQRHTRAGDADPPRDDRSSTPDRSGTSTGSGTSSGSGSGSGSGLGSGSTPSGSD